ncbi:MAG: SapC family protein [Xanthomonadales bacterium]
MTNHVLLDNVNHRDLRIRQVFAPGAGYDVNVTRVFPSEFVMAQREYPLFFMKNTETGQFDTVALLGFEADENLFLGDPEWAGDYIPLTILRQPFLIGFQQQEVDGIPQKVPVVHVDLDHPSVSTTEGEPVFLAQGGEAPHLERMTAVLQAIHEGHEQGAVFARMLVGLELIESVKVDVEFGDGSSQSLTGLFKINEDRLASLPGSALETLNAAGHLQNVFLMLASLASMSRLIERKSRKLAQAAADHSR